MKKLNVLWVVAMVLMTMPASAITGKTLYNYIAYESIFWNKNHPVTADNYPKQHLDGLEKMAIDTIVFAPCLGWGAIAGNLKNATYPKHQPQQGSAWMKNWKNAMPELMQKGIDPIAETSKWCRKWKKECVVSLPVNLLCTHTGLPTQKNPPNSWYSYMYSDFLKANVDCRMRPDEKTSCTFSRGGDSSADFTNAKVREKFIAIATEIAGKYDIDGIMIDFMMSPSLYRSVAIGGIAAPKELALTTDMMARIRAACKAAATRLGHPVSFGARVPDSVGFCKDIGIDLQGWFDTKAMDFVVLGGQFQLNHWDVVGSLALKAGIPYYASFCESGIYVGNDSGYSGDDERLPRQHPDTMRARIAEAMLAKASGCMYSEGVHFQHTIPRYAMIPYDEKTIFAGSKRYFVTYTDDRAAGGWLKDGRKYLGFDSLLSSEARDLTKGIYKCKIDVRDDFAALKKAGKEVKVVLATEIVIPSGIETEVTLNNKTLKPFKKRAGVQYYEVPLTLIKTGLNEVTAKAKGRNKRGGIPKIGNVAIEVQFPEAKK